MVAPIWHTKSAEILYCIAFAILIFKKKKKKNIKPKQNLQNVQNKVCLLNLNKIKKNEHELAFDIILQCNITNGCCFIMAKHLNIVEWVLKQFGRALSDVTSLYQKCHVFAVAQIYIK